MNKVATEKSRKNKNVLMVVVLCLCVVTISTQAQSTAKPAAKSEAILKKYESYAEAGKNENKAGVSVGIEDFMGSWTIDVGYSNPSLCSNERLARSAGERWFVADAENPEVRYSLVPNQRVSEIVDGNTGVRRSAIFGQFFFTYESNSDIFKARFLLVGFEGVPATRSKEAATPPLFFLIENKGTKSEVLTPQPRLAGNLIVSRNWIQFNGGMCQFQEVRPKTAIASNEDLLKMTLKDRESDNILVPNDETFVLVLYYMVDNGKDYGAGKRLSVLEKEGKFTASDGSQYKIQRSYWPANSENHGKYFLVVSVPKGIDVSALTFVYGNQEMMLGMPVAHNEETK